MVDGAGAAIEFYAEAFGADELFRIARPDGRIVHGEVSIGTTVFMVGDAEPPFLAPTRAGGSTVGLHVWVDDVDLLCDQAVAAGAELLQEPTDMFYGDRTIMLRDPFGHVWVFLTHLENIPVDEIVRRGAERLRAPAE
jgi:PhnB protein